MAGGVVHKIYTPSKYHLKAREFVVDTPMNFLLIPIESVNLDVLISVSLPQHALSLFLDVIPLEICSKNGIHLVPSLDPLALELNLAGVQTSQRARI